MQNNEWKVGWVWGPLPLTIINLLSHRQMHVGIRQYVCGGRRLTDGLWEYVPFTYKPYFRFSPNDYLHHMLISTVPRLGGVLQRHGFRDVDVLCIAAPGLASALEVVKAKLVIYHCPVPFWMIYQEYPAVYRAHLKLAQSSDIIIVLTEAEKADLIERSRNLVDNLWGKVKVIGHGVGLPPREKLKPRKQRSDIALVGIPDSTDIGLLKEIAQKMSDHEFGIIGPFPRRVKHEFMNLKNVRFYGKLPYGDVMDILCRSEVGLICYARHICEKKFQGNTMKFYDYAGAGLPIVTVPLIGDGSGGSMYPAVIANSADEFVGKIKYCLENFEELSSASRGVAEANSWEVKQREFREMVESELVKVDSANGV